MFLHLNMGTPLMQGALLVVGSVIFYSTSLIIYNLFFHPLRRFPGPLLHRATVLGRCHDLVSGNLPFKVLEYHKIYGPVVRIAPNELAFSKPEAWKDIYSRNKAANRYELPRDWNFYNKPKDRSSGNILESHRDHHDLLRKELSSAFSDRSLKAQEPEVKRYIDLLMKRLREQSGNDMSTAESKNTRRNQPVNVTDWIAYSTFDVNGFLTFGSDFGCLESGTYHAWVELIMGALKDLTTMAALRSFSRTLFKVLLWLAKKSGMGAKAHSLHVELTEAKTKARIELGTGRDDFLDAWIDRGMPFDQIKDNASLLIIAGSETTATALTGLLYFVLKQPELYHKLRDETRRAFSSKDGVTFASVGKLSYMHAVINEALRLYPPVPTSATRKVPASGTTIDGEMIPPGTIVGIAQYAMNRNSQFFANPNSFDPERWLIKKGDFSIYADDRLDAVNPFLTGPRNCLGMGLAFLEIRFILARLLLEFDLALSEDSQTWFEKQRIWLMWDKPPLNLILTPI